MHFFASNRWRQLTYLPRQDAVAPAVFPPLSVQVRKLHMVIKAHCAFAGDKPIELIENPMITA
jgi:hypothetical protein